MIAPVDFLRAMADGRKKPYTLADARRIAEELNLRWGRFGVERSKLVLTEESDNDGQAEPEESPDRA